mgnify:CR=1 FL=1
MSIIASARQQWLANPRRDLLAGTVVALALIPEAIAFSIIAGVDPAVGLYASVVIAVTIAFVGGRPAMISAATGAMALLMVTLVRDHGLEYLFAASILCGVFQIGIGLLKLGRYIKFVSRSVMTGFVNSLAILIFLAQTPELIGANWQTFALVAAALAVIYGLPRLTRAVPSPLVAIVLVSAFVMMTGLDVRTVGDMGQMPAALPAFHLPAVPLTWETFVIIAPISATLAFVGLLESLLTANLIDDITDTPSDKDRETRGQGIANILSPLFGGMAGCAMIGQSMINVTSGARGRLSTLWAGLFLLFLMLALQDWVARIPMAALVAVMIMVSINTFDWGSIRRLRSSPLQSSIVMVATTVTELENRFPAMRDYSDQQRQHTIEDIAHIVDFLATALYTDDDELFTQFVSWTADILAARSVPTESLIPALDSLAGQLMEFPRTQRLLAAAHAAIANPTTTTTQTLTA